MAWVKISEQEAKQHPLWDKFCWVRVLFLVSAICYFVMGLASVSVPEVIYHLLNSKSSNSTLFNTDDYCSMVFGLLALVKSAWLMYFSFGRNINLTTKDVCFVIGIPNLFFLVSVILGGLNIEAWSIGFEVFLFVVIEAIIIPFIYHTIVKNSKVYRIQYHYEIQSYSYFHK